MRISVRVCACVRKECSLLCPATALAPPLITHTHHFCLTLRGLCVAELANMSLKAYRVISLD